MNNAIFENRVCALRPKLTQFAIKFTQNLDDAEDRRYMGVMADEVLERFPEAVIMSQDGYMQVDYEMLGIEFKEVP